MKKLIVLLLTLVYSCSTQPPVEECFSKTDKRACLLEFFKNMPEDRSDRRELTRIVNKDNLALLCDELYKDYSGVKVDLKIALLTLAVYNKAPCLCSYSDQEGVDAKDKNKSRPCLAPDPPLEECLDNKERKSCLEAYFKNPLNADPAAGSAGTKIRNKENLKILCEELYVDYGDDYEWLKRNLIAVASQNDASCACDYYKYRIEEKNDPQGRYESRYNYHCKIK